MKKILIFLLISSLVFSCEKDVLEIVEPEMTIMERSNSGKIKICHQDFETNTWNIIHINKNAWKAHKAHNDIRLDDQDNDGFVPINHCEYGNMGDCDDLNGNINPNSIEICDNIDNDCNDNVDDLCIFIADFSSSEFWDIGTEGDGFIEFGAGTNGQTVILNKNSSPNVRGFSSMSVKNGLLSDSENIVVEAKFKTSIGGCGIYQYGWNGGLRFSFPGWGNITAEATAFGFRLNADDPIYGQRTTSFTYLCDGILRLELDRSINKASLFFNDQLKGSLNYNSMPGIGYLNLFTSTSNSFPGTGTIEIQNLTVSQGFVAI